jgi:crossover junction endodeoxyribonuclease RusA
VATVIRFTVLGKPEPQGSMKAFQTKNGIAMASDNKAMRPWRQQVGWAALEARSGAEIFAPLPDAIKLTVIFAFNCPQSVRKSRMAPTVKPDLDKLLRAILDAGTGILWRDDAQVVEIVSQKCYNSPARAEITVEALQ